MQKTNTTMHEIDAEQLEKDLTSYIEYMEFLNKKIDEIKRKINSEKEVLDSELNDEKQYISIITSLNTGKGEYSKINTLPYEMRDFIKSKDFQKLTEVEKAEYKENYKYAVIQSVKLDRKVKNLEADRRERLIRIKEYRKSIKKYEKDLTSYKNLYKKKLLDAKGFDKKITKYMKNKSEKTKKYVNKPNNGEDKK